MGCEESKPGLPHTGQEFYSLCYHSGLWWHVSFTSKPFFSAPSDHLQQEMWEPSDKGMADWTGLSHMS